MKKRLSHIFFAMILILISLNLYQYIIARNNIQNPNNENYENELNNYQITNQYLYNGLLVNPLDTVTNPYGQKLSLSSIIEGKTLFFVYQKGHCQSCVDKILERLSTYPFTELPENTNVLVYNQSSQNLLYKVIYYGNNIHFYSFDYIENIPGTKKSPALFMIDTNFQISDYFEVSENVEECFPKYIDILFNKYFIN